MDNNEITMFMDAKVDLQDKRPECAMFKEWTRCQVKIEAVKCLPCFLRISLEHILENKCTNTIPQGFTISVNVPGVSITLASSRTKQYSYALFWTQNRRNCYIYFALDTEISCRRHMKWLRKSIKNLELHRKLILEERRCSRGGITMSFTKNENDSLDDNNINWSQRVSEIYEEIFENNEQEKNTQKERLSRRCSGTSIASGIYEEMKLPINTSGINFDCINEEGIQLALPLLPPPPLPPLPAHRKRFNTYKNENHDNISELDAIPRCSTNPETDLAKKKKYKNMLDTIFHGSGLRSKRSVSISEEEHDRKENQLLNCGHSTNLKKSIVINKKMKNAFELPVASSESIQAPMYANDDVTAIANKRLKKPVSGDIKRNSFSSPDLSKINFIDTFDEQRIADMLNNSFAKQDEFDFSNNTSWDDFDFLAIKTKNKIKAEICPQPEKSLESQNISQQIPNNFNFSACNTSAINLIAPLSSKLTNQQILKNKIIIDDLTGYCVMAPIVKKMSAIDNTPLPQTITTSTLAHPLEYLSSGYSTGSYSSSTSTTCTNSTEDHFVGSKDNKMLNELISSQKEDSVVYENMQCPSEDIIETKNIASSSIPFDFTGNLYENLLSVKAAQELEHPVLALTAAMSTSTPTDSPQLELTKTPTSNDLAISNNIDEEEEDYYQTPRKSIISIDEKVPSYYPNTCESSVRSRRSSYSPAKLTIGEKPPMSTIKVTSPTTTVEVNTGLRHLMNSKLKRERKENISQTSPQTIENSRNKGGSPITSSIKTAKTNKKTTAHKISENVYAVTHRLKKTVANGSNNFNNNNNDLQENINKDQTNIIKEEQLQNDLLQMAILKNIDFKFEDSKDDCDRFMETKRAPLSPSHHQLKVNQIINTKHTSKSFSGSNSPTAGVNTTTTRVSKAMTQSTMSSSPTSSVATDSSVKKFTSLPRFKKFDLSPLRTRINNACAHVLQRNHSPDL